MKDNYKEFNNFYLQNVVYKKDYSFLIIDKGVKLCQKYIYYDGSKDKANYVNINKDNEEVKIEYNDCK